MTNRIGEHATFEEIVAEVERRVPWTRNEKPLLMTNGQWVWTFCDREVTAEMQGSYLRVCESWMGFNSNVNSHEVITVEVFEDGTTQRVSA